MDIFELSAMKAAFKIGGKEYDLVDPTFDKKVLVLKEFDELAEIKPQTKEEKISAALRFHQAKIAYIKVYLPTLEDQVLNEMGEKQFNAVYDKLTELAGERFGAVIKKIESEKKP